jgi:hypothetical protein
MEDRGQLLQFEETGYLKPGVHDCAWDMLRKLTFTNSYREGLGGKLLKFLRWPLRMGQFPQVYIGGGFVSDSPSPQDIDLVLETRHPFGAEAFGAMEPFFSKGLDNILRTYSVDLHFWVEGGPASLADFRSFFQYQRAPKGDRFDIQMRGIVRLALNFEDFPRLSDREEWDEEPGELVVEQDTTKSIAGTISWATRI